jgi:hypothetical protein
MAFETEFENIQIDLEELKQERLTSIDEHPKNVRKLLFEINKNIGIKKKLFSDIDAKLNESEVILFGVLRRFRFDNEDSRSDGLKPNYFNTMPSLNPVIVPKIDLKKESELVKNIENYLLSYENNLSSLVNGVYELYDKFIEQVSHLKSSK